MALWTPLPRVGLLELLSDLRQARADSVVRYIGLPILRGMLMWEFRSFESNQETGSLLLAWLYCFGGEVLLGLWKSAKDRATSPSPVA